MNITFKIIKCSVALLPLLLLFCLPLPCYANPITVIRTGSPYLWLLLWVISPLIEATIIIVLLWRRFTNSKAIIITFLLIVLLNAITFLITQIIANFLLLNLLHYTVYLAEAFPLVTEFLILLWLFKSLYRHGNISEKITVKHTILLVLMTNVVTFAIGFGLYKYFPALHSTPRF
jgi:hypothetical protein